MSIWATMLSIDADDHSGHCARWQLVPSGDLDEVPAGERWAIGYEHGKRTVRRLDADTPCSCLAGPIRYLGSHVLPSDADAHEGDLSLAYIPDHIEREGRERPAGGWPYLRLSADRWPSYVDLVLERRDVARLYHSLGEWLIATNSAASPSNSHEGETER